MKKLLVLFIALALVAPVMAMADDNLDISGQVRVRAWDRENYSDFDDADGIAPGDKEEYIDQRFRLQAVVKANDNVKGVLRVDFAEDRWGSDNWTTSRYNNDSELQVDRAYLDVTTGPVNIKAGQQFMAVGQSQVIRNNKPGVQVTIKTPVIIELGYSVQGNEDAGANEDEYNLHASVAYKSDKFKVEGFWGTQITSTPISVTQDSEDTRSVFGVNFKTNVGPVALNSELAFFGGDNEATNVDYVGTQLNVDADMKINPMVKVGADFVYSTGTDDATEDKIAFIGDPFGFLSRTEGGSGNWIFDGDLNPVGNRDVFDPFGDELGAIGIGADVVITPVTGLDILAHIMYLTAQEDAATGSGGYDDALVYNVGASYMIAPKAQIALYYNLVDADFEGTGSSDNASLIYGIMSIAF